MSDTMRAELGSALDRVLGEQLRHVRRRYLLHGVATALLLPGLAIAAAFLLDSFLRLPAPIRVFHTLLIAALAVWSVRRFVLYPLTKRLDAVEVAKLVEHTFPALHQRLVSSIQLKTTLLGDGDLRNQSPAMIDQLLAEAATDARALPLDRMFDRRRMARHWAAAGSLLLALGGAGLSVPDSVIAFLLRHLGLDVPYPRATMLVVELPPASADLKRTDGEGRVELVLPAGADLHVSVLAEGAIPDEAYLDVTIEGGTLRSIPMGSRPGGRFRHVFRRVTGDFEFHARGGDDDRGDKIVTVHTVHPPLVGQIKTDVQPPAYTGRPRTSQNGGAIEALVGSTVTLTVVATNEVKSAALVFLESGRRIDLEPARLVDDAGAIDAFRTEFAVQASDRYQVELQGGNGLRNPNPGTYPILALQDYAPVGRWLQPDDESGVMLLPEAILCVRFHAHDDFGLRRAALTTDAGGGRQTTRELLAAEGNGGPHAASALLALELLEVKDLVGATRGTDGLSLQVDLVDNREPEPNATQLPRRQVQIVDLAQLSASIGRQFRALRQEVEQSLDLQQDRKERLDELLAESPRPGAATGQVLTAIEVGQGRIQGSAERLLHGTMHAFDVHLWNRLEPSQNAAAAVDFYRSWHQEHGEAVANQPEFYRELARRRTAGLIGAMERTLDPILQMIGLTDRLGAELSQPLLRLLAEAQVARDAAELEAKLRAAGALQDRIVATLKELLSRLDEWNEYQDLVQEARSLLDRQRDVKSQTEELRDQKGGK